MAQWTITYSKDNNTSTLDMQAGHRPEMEEAVEHLLAWARENLEQGDFGDGQDKRSSEPAVLLLRHYGITITGIAGS
ncbi:hypothetical protein [Pseudomonas sp. F(2018)]|uniref:hypothetical protein n=1 Tax=Pseudomonas sp. F(2018) TaxID=2502240 RepID=UPI0010F913BF|nr:hypothetical protein [Pseudomonas sp. F(2018)]